MASAAVDAAPQLPSTEVPPPPEVLGHDNGRGPDVNPTFRGPPPTMPVKMFTPVHILPSPTMLLSGHAGSVYGLQYDPTGQLLCSTSFDQTCLIWRHSSQDNDQVAAYENVALLSGHANAVLDCAWCHDFWLVTCSADTCAALWDVNTATRLRKFKDAGSVLNAVAVVPESSSGSTQFVTVSDDGWIRRYDARQRAVAHAWQVYPDATVPVLAVAATTNVIYTAGLDNMVRAWDERMMQNESFIIGHHADSVTSLAVNPGGTRLASNGLDQALQIWDIRAFAQQSSRHLRTLHGHTHAPGALQRCAWNADGTLVTCGSSDRLLHIWDVATGAELYTLPGHTGAIHAVAFHPSQANLVASGASDDLIYVGELS
jgi:Prp8 binding protein